MLEVGAGLSTGNVIAIGALCLALTAGALTPYLASLRSLARRTKKLEADLAEHLRESESRRKIVAAVGARGFAAAASSLEFASGLVQRVLEDRTGEIDAGLAMRELHGLRLGVERASMEARLLSDDRTVQESALQQLAHRRGDAATEDLLRQGHHVGRLGNLDAAMLGDAADAIERRRSST